MAVNAKLVVVLKANEVEVAQSDDPALWQQVLTAISKGVPTGLDPDSQAQANHELNDSSDHNGPLSKMAAALDVEVRVLKGACNPTSETPFIQLDAHRYEAMRKALPARGANAITNIQIAGTLLGLWFYYLGQSNATQAQAQTILDGLGQRDSNPGRGISNADWLQVRNSGQFAINPAEISRAVSIAQCFCRKDWTSYLHD